ncbi:unnamed protein product [Somion occarium]|uniref:Uncharacterized protein n=1 Tax=Somion occarium TaxID=3059160 RepID=A0ABP1D7N7_9APHY
MLKYHSSWKLNGLAMSMRPSSTDDSLYVQRLNTTGNTLRRQLLSNYQFLSRLLETPSASRLEQHIKVFTDLLWDSRRVAGTMCGVIDSKYIVHQYSSSNEKLECLRDGRDSAHARRIESSQHHQSLRTFVHVLREYSRGLRKSINHRNLQQKEQMRQLRYRIEEHLRQQARFATNGDLVWTILLGIAASGLGIFAFFHYFHIISAISCSIVFTWAVLKFTLNRLSSRQLRAEQRLLLPRETNRKRELERELNSLVSDNARLINLPADMNEIADGIERFRQDSQLLFRLFMKLETEHDEFIRLVEKDDVPAMEAKKASFKYFLDNISDPLRGYARSPVS